MTDDSHKINYTAKIEDYTKAQSIVMKKYCFALGAYNIAAAVLTLAVFHASQGVLKDLVYFRLPGLLAFAVPMAVFLAVYFLFIMFFHRFGKRPSLTYEGGAFSSPLVVMIDEEGLSQVGEHTSVRTAWAGVFEIRHEKGFIMVFLDKTSMYVIPERAFAGAAEARGFYEQALQFWRAKTGNPL